VPIAEIETEKICIGLARQFGSGASRAVEQAAVHGRERSRAAPILVDPPADRASRNAESLGYLLVLETGPKHADGLGAGFERVCENWHEVSVNTLLGPVPR